MAQQHLEGIVYREFANQRTGKREVVKGYRIGSPALAAYTAKRARAKARRRRSAAAPVAGLLRGIL